MDLKTFSKKKKSTGHYKTELSGIGECLSIKYVSISFHLLTKSQT